MNDLRIDVADLLSHAAARRAVQLSAVVDDLGTPMAAIREPVDLDLRLERVSEGIVVRGTLRARYASECGTCLRPLTAEVSAEVSELFEDHPLDGETYPIEGHHIDLQQLTRDTVLLELPIAPVCSAGDPECVADPDPNADADTDVETGPAADPRWAALSTIKL